MEISTAAEFVTRTIQIAKELGYPVARNRDGYLQIDFGHKKLHEAHLKSMFSDTLDPGVNISKLIERIAPGRPCTHKPMKTIIAKMQVAART